MNKERGLQNNTVLGIGEDYKGNIWLCLDNGISIIEFDIPEGYNRFTAKAGLDKECIEHTEGASVKFLVFTKDPAGPLPADSIKVPIKLEQLGLYASCTIKDLWSGKNLGVFTDEFSPVIKRHGAKLYRLSIKK